MTDNKQMIVDREAGETGGVDQPQQAPSPSDTSEIQQIQQAVSIFVFC